jgi:hypothetical protein
LSSHSSLPFQASAAALVHIQLIYDCCVQWFKLQIKKQRPHTPHRRQRIRIDKFEQRTGSSKQTSKQAGKQTSSHTWRSATMVIASSFRKGRPSAGPHPSLESPRRSNFTTSHCGLIVFCRATLHTLGDSRVSLNTSHWSDSAVTSPSVGLRLFANVQPCSHTDDGFGVATRPIAGPPSSENCEAPEEPPVALLNVNAQVCRAAELPPFTRIAEYAGPLNPPNQASAP